MEQHEKWPDEVRLKMVEKSEYYDRPAIYQYGYYDGYTAQNEKIERLQEEEQKFDRFVQWLESNSQTVGLYRAYLDTIIPPIILVRTNNQ